MNDNLLPPTAAPAGLPGKPPTPPIVSALKVPPAKTEQEVSDDTPESRKNLVNEWSERIRSARDFWQPTFERMRDDMRFAAGQQWGGQDDKNQFGLKKYVANIVQRQCALKAASLYAKNPEVSAKRRPKMDFKVWDKLFTDQGVVKLIVEGPPCKRYMDQLVQNIIRSSFEVQDGPHKIAMVNTTIAWSEVGEELCKKYPEADFSMTYTVHRDYAHMSLRSDNKNPNAFDVGTYAEQFGGGGHRHAAGFQVPASHITRWLADDPLIKEVVAF